MTTTPFLTTAPAAAPSALRGFAGFVRWLITGRV